MIKLNNGRIILLNGDCLHEMKRIKPNSIDMVFADLPYNVSKMSDYIGIEKDENYFNIATQRIEQSLTKPVNASTDH